MHCPITRGERRQGPEPGCENRQPSTITLTPEEGPLPTIVRSGVGVSGSTDCDPMQPGAERSCPVRIGEAMNIQVIPGIVAASPGRPRGASGHSSGPSAGKIGMRAEPLPRLSEAPSPWRSCCPLRVRPRWSQGEAPRLPSRAERSEEHIRLRSKRPDSGTFGGNPAGHRAGRRRTCVVDVDSADLHQRPLPGEYRRSRWHGATLWAHARP